MYRRTLAILFLTFLLCFGTAEAQNLFTVTRVSDGSIQAAYALMKSTVDSSQKGKDQIHWQDARIEIRIDKIDRADLYPADLRAPGYKYRPPEAGKNFVVVYMTITHIRNIHVVGLGGRGDTKSSLRDTEGDEYASYSWNVKGFKYLDPHDIRSPSELIQGATIVLLFEIPTNKKPATLTFVYYFKETWEQQSKGMGKIDIKIDI